jgi:hypothetical protein
MAKSWKDLTLDEAVERAKGISRQALHIAIKTYTANGRTDIVEQLRQVRKTLKRDKRIEKVGKDVVEAVEAEKAARAARIAEYEASGAVLVKGYGGKWSVTRDGRVWSHSHDKWLKPTESKTNPHSKKRYLFISNGISVHRLIALTFLPNPNRHRNVRHKDDNPANNHVDNLEWFGKIVGEEAKTDA